VFTVGRHPRPGRGGTGEVRRAKDTATDRVVAPKVLPASLANDQVFQHRPEAK
jgi:serine/threonine protein kinase